MGYCITKPYDERLGTENGFSITNSFYATDYKTDADGVCYLGGLECPSLPSMSDFKMDYVTRLTLFESGSVEDGVVFLELIRCKNVKISPSVHFVYMKDCADIDVPASVLVLSAENSTNINVPKIQYQTPYFNPNSDKVQTVVLKQCSDALLYKIDEVSLTLNPEVEIDLNKPNELVRVAVEFRNELLFRDWITPSLISKDKAMQILAERKKTEKKTLLNILLAPFKFGGNIIAAGGDAVLNFGDHVIKLVSKLDKK